MATSLGFGNLKESVIDTDLCCLCGTCGAACPQGLIRCDGEDGVPSLLSPEACLDCGACSEVCPGRDVPYKHLLAQRPSGGDNAPHFGPHLARLSAASTDAGIRAQGAAGGFVTALLSSLLESGEIVGAVVAGSDERQPWRSVGRVARRPEDLLSSACSRYSLVPVMEAMRDAEGPLALVGLPCHVLAFRKLEQWDPSVSARVPMVVGLFCGVNLDPRATVHMLHELGVEDRSQVTQYCSRSANYGGVRVQLRDGRTLRYPDNDGYAFDVVRLAPLYLRTRCALCFDNVNELADVSVGDDTGPERKRSCVVARTSRALELIERAEREGRIERRNLDPEMHRENVFKKRRRAWTVLEWMRKRRMPTVEPDFEIDPDAYPWASEAHRQEMLALMQLSQTDIGRRVLQTLPRDSFAREVGLAYVGWRE
ncbi:MAG: Coenzyme F420 hydrogenase/dehydrogenase, beta subunit C-terminal domain [Candidatus Latescibacteria bacterium]|nr:Coenzyme F420 hydrogenase/dehydrogenase, beta subunit C-terminal domain [Candidatus Latescibacterota bacterium]